jgi:serine/threonine protein kinase
MRLLHRKKITHRDLKLGNLMIYRKCFNQWKIKLADFGLSIAPSTGEKTKNEKIKSPGTEGYFSP